MLTVELWKERTVYREMFADAQSSNHLYLQGSHVYWTELGLWNHLDRQRLESQWLVPCSGTSGHSASLNHPLFICGDDCQLFDDDFKKAIPACFRKLLGHKIHLESLPSFERSRTLPRKFYFLKASFRTIDNLLIWNIKYILKSVTFFTEHLKIISVQRLTKSKMTKFFWYSHPWRFFKIPEWKQCC